MKTPMELALDRVELMKSINPDCIHWEMTKINYLAHEKNEMLKFGKYVQEYIFNEDEPSIGNSIKFIYEQYQREKNLALLAKQAQEEKLGYDDFELGGEG